MTKDEIIVKLLAYEEISKYYAKKNLEKMAQPMLQRWLNGIEHKERMRKLLKKKDKWIKER